MCDLVAWPPDEAESDSLAQSILRMDIPTDAFVREVYLDIVIEIVSRLCSRIDRIAVQIGRIVEVRPP